MQKRLREIQKNNSTIGLNTRTPYINNFQTIKNFNYYDNSMNINILSTRRKSNLPELKLTKKKFEQEINDIENVSRNIEENIYNYKTNNNKYPVISHVAQKKSNSMIKNKKNIFFPKLNNNNNYEYNDLNVINNNKNNQNFKNDFSMQELSANNNQNKQFITINNINNITNRKKTILTIRNNKENLVNNRNNMKKSSNSLNKNNNNYKTNEINNINLRPRLRSLNKNRSNRLKKDKSTKKINHKHIYESIPKPQPNIEFNSNEFNKNNLNKNIINNYNNKDKIENKGEDTKIIKDIKNENQKTNSINNTNSTSEIKDIISKEEEIKEIESMTKKINDITDLLNKFYTLTDLLSLSKISNQNSNIQMDNLNYNKKTPVEISPSILTQTFKNFINSTTSAKNEFSKEDIIKSYAYNSSMGNIRNYNEDTITVEKINNNFYFFALYDGHGGNCCSLYLKNNLHKKIDSFSKESLKIAIEKSESEFLKNEAIDINNDNMIKDYSGSCGIMAMIQNKKLIIANVGDSRIVIYKKGKVEFVTEDHKPDSEKEKKRINLAGGEIYQNQTIMPLYQNGRKIEIPWRVIPGRLSVSRTFGDIEAKEEKYGGKKGVVVAEPDIYEMEIDNDYNFMIIGCDGIFDVLSNEELLDCLKIVYEDKKIKDVNNVDMEELCGDFAGMIIKSAMAKDSFDNVSCIVVMFSLNNIF